MDLSHIVVLVMVLIAAGFLARFEMNSRQNARKQALESQAQPPQANSK
jgi:hypothetical protein